MPRSIERVALDVVQEPYRQSPHHFSNVTGALLESCDSRTLKQRKHGCSSFAAFFND